MNNNEYGYCKIPKRILDVHVGWAHLDPSSVKYIPCLLCGSSCYEPLASLVINRVEFFIVRCSLCKLVWRNPIPGKLFLCDLYSDKYYNVFEHSPSLVYQAGIPDFSDSDKEMRRQKAQKEVGGWIQRGILSKGGDKHKKFLEIGGGSGYLQHVVDEIGWDTIGLEISTHGIREAMEKGLFVLPTTLDELCDKYLPYKGYFDLIAFFDFLEHVEDPGSVLRTVKHVLKNDGIVIIRIPVTDKCPSLHLVDHIWHFSTNTIGLIINNEGFEIISSHDSGKFIAPNGDFIDNITLFLRKKT